MNPFEKLGVDKSADTERILDGYLRLARSLHPAAIVNGGSHLQQLQEVTAAFLAIASPQQRHFHTLADSFRPDTSEDEHAEQLSFIQALVSRSEDESSPDRIVRRAREQADLVLANYAEVVVSAPTRDATHAVIREAAAKLRQGPNSGWDLGQFVDGHLRGRHGVGISAEDLKLIAPVLPPAASLEHAIALRTAVYCEAAAQLAARGHLPSVYTHPTAAALDELANNAAVLFSGAMQTAGLTLVEKRGPAVRHTSARDSDVWVKIAREYVEAHDDALSTSKDFLFAVQRGSLVSAEASRILEGAFSDAAGTALIDDLTGSSATGTQRWLAKTAVLAEVAACAVDARAIAPFPTQRYVDSIPRTANDLAVRCSTALAQTFAPTPPVSFLSAITVDAHPDGGALRRYVEQTAAFLIRSSHDNVRQSALRALNAGNNPVKRKLADRATSRSFESMDQGYVWVQWRRLPRTVRKPFFDAVLGQVAVHASAGTEDQQRAETLAEDLMAAVVNHQDLRTIDLTRSVLEVDP